jgi:choline dehydrogenase
MSKIIIVGAGSAGMTLAWRLSNDPSTEVVLIEAGVDPGPDVPESLRREMLLPPEYYWGYLEADTHAFLPRGKVLGGSSAVNAAAAVRGQPWCFDSWGVENWDWEACLPAFVALENDLQFGDRPHHGSSGPFPITRYPTKGFDAAFGEVYGALGYNAIEDHNGPPEYGYAPWPTNRDNNDDRASTLLQLLPDLRQRSNVTILASTEVSKVAVNAGVATGVLVATTNGDELIESDVVVLAGGTFGSPEMLFGSGIGHADHLRAAGIDVLADLPGVGQNLSDHAFLQMVVEVTDPTRYALGAGQGTLLTIELDEPGKHLAHLFAYQTSFFDPTAADSAASVTAALMTPASRGGLTFGADGKASVRLGHYTHPDDLSRGAAIVERVNVVIDKVAETGLIRAPDDAWWKADNVESLLRNVAVTYHHPVGTCRMGTGNDAVVGPDLKVHGIDGLYVADASIMPTLPRATTNLATLMIGWRAADLLTTS